MNALDIYQRGDGRWAWRMSAANGEVIATDGGQGYENRADCADIAGRILAGYAGQRDAATRLLVVASSCLSRGLTAEETDMVAIAISEAPSPETAGDARTLIETAIADELKRSRGIELVL